MASHDHGAWTGWKAGAYALFHRNPASSRAVVEWARLRPDMQVLDVGCGTGAAVIAAAPLLIEGAVVGIDPSPDFVRIASHRAHHLPNASFQIAAAEELPFASHRFDLAWSVHSTHHWHDLTGGFGEVRRVLRQGGRFLIVERHVADRPWGISSQQAEALAHTLAETGFVSVGVDERMLRRTREYLITGEIPSDDDALSAGAG
jgi:ubiquinone/menaquinone biosynthesis C-methylase UbiE